MLKTSPPKADDFSDRYAPNWEHITRFAHCLTRRTCTCCMVRPSEEVHHCYYLTPEGYEAISRGEWPRKLKPLAGGEVPGRDVFPLCQQCHDAIAHSLDNWIKDKTNPKLLNRNTPEYVQLLRLNFRILTHATTRNHPNLRRKTPRHPAKR